MNMNKRDLWYNCGLIQSGHKEMNRMKIAITLAYALGTAVMSVAEEPKPPLNIFGESEAAKQQRMAWWTEARFGMFIDFGLLTDRVPVQNRGPCNRCHQMISRHIGFKKLCRRHGRGCD